MEECKYSSTHS